MPPSTIEAIRGELRAVTLACVPAAERMDERAWARAEGIMSDALAQRPASVRSQLVLFVRVVSLIAFLRWGRGLAALDAERTLKLLSALERAPLLVVRRGTWGLRTLAFMGVYAQPEIRKQIGYAAALRGWEARGASPGPWPDRNGAAAPEPGVLTAGSADARPAGTGPSTGADGAASPPGVEGPHA